MRYGSFKPRSVRMNKRLNNLIFVWSIMLLTTMMTIMPLPEFFHGIRIEWVSLAIIFFSMMNVSLMGVIAAWTIGLLLDLLQGGLLGENALILSIISYLSYRFRFQVRVYPDWQLMIVTLFFLSFGNLISLWIRGFSGRMLFVTEEWLSIFIAALIWPIFMRMTEILQNYFIED
ncbi:MAG: rod shape-determining protein MreD [Gammaproteobacteria bacterium]|nr:MAG: rod shape-determining protein MreD [Gammaproteobacteria bacterium]